jgi:hypothetical protein
MGLFTQMQDMAEMMKAAPGLIEQAKQLSEQAAAFRQPADVRSMVAHASAAMADAREALSAMTLDSTSPEQEARRVRTTASVVDARQRPMMIGMDAVVDVDLDVAAPGYAGRTCTLVARVSQLQLARLAPGASLVVSLVPEMPETLRIEW